MATTNTKSKAPVRKVVPTSTRVAGTPTRTFEGAPAMVPADKELLRRLVLSNLLWEDNFYVNGKEVGSLLNEVTQRLSKSDPSYVRQVAIEARKVHHLRHVPLWVIVGLAQARTLTADVVESVVSRPDEMGELLSLYRKANGRTATGTGPKKLSKQLQKGLAKVFGSFDAYQLAKWNRDKDVSLRDVMFLTHPRPDSEEKVILFRELVDDKMEAPDTWEVNLSAGKDKKETFTRLLQENKLGYDALLKNLRNMREAGVDEDLVFNALIKGAAKARTLPFQFIAAAKHNPTWESKIEEAMLLALKNQEKLTGTTVLLVDVSGSMGGSLGGKSELQRLDAASALAMLVREICEKAAIFTFDSTCTRLPDRRGFALRDAIGGPRGGTALGAALSYVGKEVKDADRIIVFTDEQSNDRVGKPPAKKGYIMNVASYKQGVGYDTGFIHIDGFSESVVKFIQELEKGE